MTPEAIKEQAARLKRACKKTPLLLSAHSGKGVPEALRALGRTRRHRPARARPKTARNAAPAWQP